MRAQVLTGHGGPEALDYRTDWPVPEPGSLDVLVEVSACGMNNTDINTRVGWYAGGSWGGSFEFPRIQGADPVGRIVGVGREVPDDRVGERVMVDPWLRDADLTGARYLGSEVDGGFADYVVVPSTNARAIRTELSDVELAVFACSYSTAEHMLERAGVSADEWVLVTGASGGVGTALIQLAGRRRAKVVAATSKRKMAAVGEAGADVVLDRDADLADQVLESTGGVDVFADVVGGPAFPGLFETIKRGGRYVVSGAVAGPVVDLDLRTLYLHDLTMHGATVVPEHVFDRLVGCVERDELRPLVDRTFGLEELTAAQEYLLRREHVGSIVIDMEK